MRLPGGLSFRGQKAARWDANEMGDLSSGSFPYCKVHTPSERMPVGFNHVIWRYR